MPVGDMDWYIWHSFLSLVITLVIQALFQGIQWHLLMKQCKQLVLLTRQAKTFIRIKDKYYWSGVIYVGNQIC
ncbi:hypothetical protein K492DRAFT_26860 [Lichtheimia hyalospora FSU 10163]|nr:hypothetical protein K492DRAFT_26860 [Lichtheimia hyalospora FSU 10163]